MRKLYVFSVLLLFLLENYQVNCTDDNINLSRWRRSFQTVSLSRQGRTCHDFCSMIPNFCRNGGSCVTDERTCIGKCICAPGWTGQWCKIPVAAQDTPEPISSNNFTGIVNVTRGPERSTSMVASKSSSSLSTGQQTAITPKTINPTTKDVDEDDIEKHEKQFSERTFQMRSFGPRKTAEDNAELEACLKSCTNGECIKMDDIYKCKQEVNGSDSACGPGFPCKHGVCDLKALKNNSYSCICEKNYVGQFCTLKCPLDCGEHGYCDILLTDNTFKCFCAWNYTGVNCSEVVPDDPEPPLPEEVTFHWYIVAVSITVVIVTVGMTFILAYLLWRRRLVFMLKIVHYFQQYEEDDGKEFDAFVSYKSCPRDESFVLNELYPKLETEFKFKLCMHFRDFLPGEAIANNIVKAIESSRRTIIVLSPDYVQSEWCRMEYQKAQHEMLKLKHKIIPVVLEDLSEVNNVDKNLKSILNSVTYLEWPGSENTKRVEKFWKKLELSLPKKSSTSPTSSSETSSIPISPPISDSIPASSELVSSLNSSLPSGTVSNSVTVSNILSKADSPSLSSVTTDSNSPKFLKGKRKHLRHFMDRLVRSKIFSRQDSNSSQTALVDEEALGTRSICGSVSESILSESSDSLCSNSDIPNQYIDEAVGAIDPDNTRNLSKPYCRYGMVNKSIATVTDCTGDNLSGVNTEKERRVVTECEKDHCDGAECELCAKRRCQDLSMEDMNSVYVNQERLTMQAVECEYCTYMRCRSDNNRIRISAVEGYHQLKVQRLPYDFPDCPCCNHLLDRTLPSRASMKDEKDAKNLRIMHEKRMRVGSLPRHYRGSRVHARLDNTSTATGDFVVSEIGESNQVRAPYVNEGFLQDVCERV